MNIAIVIGDERVHQAAWPPDLNIKTYPANTRDAERAVDGARRGTINVIVTHARWTPPAVRAVLRRQSCARVLTWERGSISELAANLHEFVGLPKPETTTEENTVNAKPYVRVVHATKSPERRPPWSEDERAALTTAYDDAVDFAKVIDGFLDLTRDLDAPVRSQAEVRAEIERLRGGGLQEPEIDADDIFDLLHMCLGLAVLDVEHRRLCEMATTMLEVATKLDESRDANLRSARLLREASRG